MAESTALRCIRAQGPLASHGPSRETADTRVLAVWSFLGDTADVPPPPVPRNLLAQEPPPGSAVEFSHNFFLIGYWVFHGSGGCRTAIQVCRTTFHVCCYGSPIRGDPISYSQAHIPLKPLPPALDPFPEATSP